MTEDEAKRSDVLWREVIDEWRRRQWPCPKCGAESPDENGHDPCISNLPGVKFACCGHGRGPGYVSFTDGRIIRGVFDVPDPEHPLFIIGRDPYEWRDAFPDDWE
jgi:hypothetical protein